MGEGVADFFRLIVVAAVVVDVEHQGAVAAFVDLFVVDQVSQQSEKKIQFVSGVSQVCQSQWWRQANLYFNVARDDNLCRFYGWAHSIDLYVQRMASLQKFLIFCELVDKSGCKPK